MTIQALKALEDKLPVESDCTHDFRDVAYDALEALEAEAWYPIEDAEKMGAKDGRLVVIYQKPYDPVMARFKNGMWRSHPGEIVFEPTHFRFMNLP
jgi:hypothetical protein